jgi:methionyl aminopeptidase
MENKKNIENYKLAGEIHKNVCHYISPYLNPGIKLIEICHLIENKIRELSKEYRLKYDLPEQYNDSVAFPTGVSLNNVAAHYTPRENETTVLTENDVCKIDYGVHINGCIVDSAMTISLNNKYSILLEASREATNRVITNLGVDVRFKELSLIAQEIVCSYEIEIDNNIVGLKPIDNLCGHNIKPYNIHAGKYLYSVMKEYDKEIVEENDVIAVEVFVSTGSGTTILDTNKDNYSHYMLNKNNNKNNILYPIYRIKRTNDVMKIINKNFSTLAFCPRFINYFNGLNKNLEYSMCLNELFRNNIVNSYPPLLDPQPNSLVAQFEHTSFITENGTIILSK